MSSIANEESAAQGGSKTSAAALAARAHALADAAREASRQVAAATAGQRTRAIEVLAARIDERKFRERLLAANALDVAAAKAAGQSASWIDRLALDEKRLTQLGQALREVAAQPDPVGEVTESRTRPNGLSVEKIRAPLGSILMIYEARPNVTADAAALCLRAGNAALLRGGKEAYESNRVLIEGVQDALAAADLPREAVQLVEPDRALLDVLLTLEDRIDLCIPRGGPSLIRLIAEKSRIPVIKHYQGVCHLYVAPDADLAVAGLLAVNGKAQRPSVCNALEGLLVDASSMDAQLPHLARALWLAGVELRCDARALPLVERALAAPLSPGEETELNGLLARAGVPAGRERKPALGAVESDFGCEFSELKLLVAVVDGLSGALDHIAKFGSRHTEAICTRDEQLAREFIRRVDASCAVVNASTRFNDGGELGLGAEIGISTSKLHAYGPMGARELTCTRFVVRGDGQARR